MNTNEKILLVQMILEDVGYNDSDTKNRVSKAKSLCEQIAVETNGNVNYTILADFCDTYISTGKKFGDWDGRFFRQAFPMGYNGMDKLHKLKHTYQNKSENFKSVANEYITSPEVIFDDWELINEN